ncbi:hypothetical protein R6Q59_002984 [Mikania micrantha]
MQIPESRATHPEVVRGLNSCIARFEPNNARRVSASKQELCSEMEYEQIFECEQGNGESRKGQVTDIQPLDSHRPLEYEHEDDDLNFLDDE